jgi:small nuclear ribonucleoprotein (snRNP)-like protein
MSRSRVLTSRFRERVIVTTKTGDTFSGVLYSCDDKALVLRDASALGAGERSADLPLDGEIIVLFPDISFIQKP